MVRHWSYFKYVIRHKWFVAIACVSYGLWWRAIKHDWSKFLPCEWEPYATSFYNKDGSKRDWNSRCPFEKVEFNVAWNHHQKVNDHHWQFWCLITDDEEPRYRPLPMPDNCIKEMVADWVGAGRAIIGRIEVCEWYAKNSAKMTLHPDVRKRVEELLKDWEYGVFRNESARERIRVLGY